MTLRLDHCVDKPSFLCSDRFGQCSCRHCRTWWSAFDEGQASLQEEKDDLSTALVDVSEMLQRKDKRIQDLENAMLAMIAAGPAFPHYDIAKRALGIQEEAAPRSTEELRKTLKRDS